MLYMSAPRQAEGGPKRNKGPTDDNPSLSAIKTSQLQFLNSAIIFKEHGITNSAAMAHDKRNAPLYCIGSA